MVQPQGQVIGKYEILGEIGRGGFATVYRAVDTTLEREVALKVLDPLLMRDEAFVARFQQEARAAAGLEHPHIVPIYEVGEADARLYIALRLVRGPSLAERLKSQECIPWNETLAILRQVGDALTYAHEQGVIHRDIKPQNILLDPRTGAMLTDFGFARLVGTSTLTQSLSGGIVGTPAYIAPEIWEGKKATPATDIYALACVTYEMLTGEVLFQGETPMAVMRAHDRGAQLPGQWTTDVPPDVGRILDRALSRAEERRYPDVSRFLDALIKSEATANAAGWLSPTDVTGPFPNEVLGDTEGLSGVPPAMEGALATNRMESPRGTPLDGPVVCPKCGVRNDALGVICRKCGTRLKEGTPKDDRAIAGCGIVAGCIGLLALILALVGLAYYPTGPYGPNALLGGIGIWFGLLWVVSRVVIGRRRSGGP